MPEKIVQLNEEVIKGQIKELVRGSVEETLNELLEAEAEKLTQAARYERSDERQGYRSGHYSRNLTTTSGDVTLKVPKLKGISFETAIIERYRRRESSVEEALIEMYLAGVSVRRVEDITEALWGSRVSPSTISGLNKKAYVHIEEWRNRPLQGGRYPYVYVDGIYLRRNWGGEYENVAILVAIAVNEDGYREVLGAAEGMKEDKASWISFFEWLRGRGLNGVKLIVGDKCLGMPEAVGEVFPEAKYQRCTVHFYRNVFSVTPRSKVKLVAKMLKAIHAQESKKAAYPEQSTYSSADFLRKLFKWYARRGIRVECVQTDNGFEFTNRFSNSKRDLPTLFESAAARLGIRHKLIRPYTPRHNGKVERSHREDQKRFYSCHSFYSPNDFAKQLAVHNRRSNNFPMRPLGWLSPFEFAVQYV